MLLLHPDVAHTIIESDDWFGYASRMGAGAPRDGDLLPTGRMELVTSFDGSSPIGGTTDKPTYYDDEFKARHAFSCDTIQTKIYDPAYDLHHICNV